MTDHTAGSGHGTSSHPHHPARTPRAEFYTYFTLIFLFAIPLSALGKPDKKTLRARYWGDAGRQVN